MKENLHLEEQNMDTMIEKSPLSYRVKRRVSLKDTSMFEENDDAAELSSRRKSVYERRKSLGLGHVAQMPTNQMEERIKLCIKLNAENKINTRNAFSLEAIDILTCMAKQKNTNFSNLQVASSSLDVSSKVYGFRVDCVHTEVLKMMGVLDKQDKKDEDDEESNECNKEEQDNNILVKDGQKTKVKRKKRSQKVLGTIDALKANIEIKTPISLMMQEEDPQTSDMLYQTILPIKGNNDYYTLYSTEKALDHLQGNVQFQERKLPDLRQSKGDLVNLDISPGLVSFQFQGWSLQDETDIELPLKCDNKIPYQFDLDASLPNDDNNMTMASNDVEYQEPEGNAEKVTHYFYKSITSNLHNKSLEYSYMQNSDIICWVGPGYWKINVKGKNLKHSTITESCGNIKRQKKKKDIELMYANGDIEECKQLFQESQSTTLSSKTTKNWVEEKLVCQDDIYHEIKQLLQLYLRPNTNFKVIKNDINTTHLSDDNDVYNYNNEHDTSEFCPNVNTDEENNEEMNVNMCNMNTQGALIGDNLVTMPDMVGNVYIPYSRKAKKIDMCQLKKSIYKCLEKSSKKEENIRGDETQQNFSQIYRKLPNLLTKNNIEALSIPVAFVSLLHLANEKTLLIKHLTDFTDLVVSAH